MVHHIVLKMAETKLGGDVQKRLGMAEEEKAPRRQLIVESLDDVALGRFVKVDENVAAKMTSKAP